MFSFSDRQNISPVGKGKDTPYVLFFRSAKYFTSRKRKRYAVCSLFPIGKIFHQPEKEKIRRMFSFSDRQNISPVGKGKDTPYVLFFRSAKYFTSRKRKRYAVCSLFPIGKIFHQPEKEKIRRMFSFSDRQNISPVGKGKDTPYVLFFRSTKYFTSRKRKRYAACSLFPIRKIFHQSEKEKIRRMFSFSDRQNISPAGKRKDTPHVFFFPAVEYFAGRKKESSAECALLPVPRPDFHRFFSLDGEL